MMGNSRMLSPSLCQSLLKLVVDDPFFINDRSIDSPSIVSLSIDSSPTVNSSVSSLIVKPYIDIGSEFRLLVRPPTRVYKNLL